MFSFLLSICLALTGFSMTGMSDLIYSDGHGRSHNLAIDSTGMDFELPDYAISAEEEVTGGDSSLLAYREEEILNSDPTVIRRPISRISSVPDTNQPVVRRRPIRRINRTTTTEDTVVSREPVKRTIEKPSSIYRRPSPVSASTNRCQPPLIITKANQKEAYAALRNYRPCKTSDWM